VRGKVGISTVTGEVGCCFSGVRKKEGICVDREIECSYRCW
jgi:hypothetical protein